MTYPEHVRPTDPATSAGTAPVQSPRRIAEGYILTTEEYVVDGEVTWPAHEHAESELLWCASGSASLEADGRRWTIPPSLAVWVPAGVRNAAGAAAGSLVRATFFDVAATRLVDVPDVVTGVAMTDAVRVLLMHNHLRDLDDAARRRLHRVVLDLLVPVPHESFDLLLPRTGHLRWVAESILADPGDRRTTEEWASRCGLHPRTLARQFHAETGVTFTRWRILARMQWAIRELALGAPVLAVSRQVGYRSPSAFLAHFRELTGQTPTAYVGRPAPVVDEPGPGAHHVRGPEAHDVQKQKEVVPRATRVPS
ncbi:DNA-binding domain-containing protein, AraC-type [Sanguibacter keddieii DSM 10542]|uniref:DNA-binding domain-containing protein, AraC-type n=1 Tax=Sanguibacter keddieii (strain ATCC 51767 / DSM 10542 / NCFB 3025 / ST-74) TaxID=446469 RepID=D1BHF8_SANKS|nr:DNA-binding domain-containing protein, AraC-type [Sanguibacter keddieii DSM 10542]